MFRVACIILGVAAATPLDRYSKKIQTLARQWPSAWHLIYLAEDKARYEHFNRLKSKIEFEIEAGRPAPLVWDLASPWDVVFLMAAKDDAKFWDENVRQEVTDKLTRDYSG